MRKRLWLALLILSLSLVLQVLDNSSALAGPPPEPDDSAGVRGSTGAGAGNLVYRGGPILTAPHTVYLIYWIPGGYSVSPRYRTLIDTFMGNVAADSGKASNVYSGVTQYKDNLGQRAAYQISFGGSVVDTGAFPANGCTNPTTSVCINDSQARAKLSAVMSAQGWIAGFDKVYFLLLPKNVGSCYDETNAYCSFVQYCAYHAYRDNAPNPVLYSTIPYAMTNSGKCGSYSHPSGDEADSTINILSHEHGEIITDPLHSAWYNATDRKERSDKCTWQFGQHLGWTVYGKFNQQIGTGKYYLQTQWSNAAQSCVLNGS